MAAVDPQRAGLREEQDETDESLMQERNGLRYLEIVHIAAVQALACLAGIYSFAKKNAGPLRPGVDAVEGTVVSVAGPVYDRFHGVPFDVLAFVDEKVGEVLEVLDRHLPEPLKAASAQAYEAAQVVPDVARELTDEVQRSGVSGAAQATIKKIEPVARDLYTRYEPAVEHIAVSTWQSLNALPLFPHLAHLLVPTAAHCAKRYNSAVNYAAKHGLPAAQYIPPIPVERIAEVFGSNGRDCSSKPKLN